MAAIEITPRAWRRAMLLHRLAAEGRWARVLRARRERIGRRA